MTGITTSESAHYYVKILNKFSAQKGLLKQTRGQQAFALVKGSSQKHLKIANCEYGLKVITYDNKN